MIHLGSIMDCKACCEPITRRHRRDQHSARRGLLNLDAGRLKLHVTEAECNTCHGSGEVPSIGLPGLMAGCPECSRPGEVQQYP